MVMNRTRPFLVGWTAKLSILGFLAILSCPASWTQAATQAPVSQETVQMLLQRIDQLEARVSQLEAKEGKAETGNVSSKDDPVISPKKTVADPAPERQESSSSALVSTQTKPSVPAPSEQAQPESVMNDRMDISKTLLRIHGFGDVELHGDTQQGDTTSFSLGQLDLFITSDISDQFKFLSEVVFEGGPDHIYGTQVGSENSFSVDIERYLLQYSLNDYFNLSIGRGHTAIGYYNTAYHHSSWLQTTTDRPFLFEFEDRGGILPIHTVGASASGMIPSGRLGLHYVAEIGNGRESRNPMVNEPVQNELDDQNHKAFNLALFSRPEKIHGFQTGFSVYRDLLAPANAPRIGETILAAHAILIRPKYEWLSEALLDRHAPLGTTNVFHTPGFYTQVSRQFGQYRPYFRYEYVNVPNREPVFPDVALRHGPIAGLRFDPNEAVALKFEYQYTFLRNQPGVNGLTAQVGFTF
jgi:hypothetical protein